MDIHCHRHTPSSPLWQTFRESHLHERALAQLSGIFCILGSRFCSFMFLDKSTLLFMNVCLNVAALTAALYELYHGPRPVPRTSAWLVRRGQKWQRDPGPLKGDLFMVLYFFVHVSRLKSLCEGKSTNLPNLLIHMIFVLSKHSKV